MEFKMDKQDTNWKIVWNSIQLLKYFKEYVQLSSERSFKPYKLTIHDLLQ